MALTPAVRKQLIEGNRVHERDTGSPEVQVSILTNDIRTLTEHLRVHPKDFSSRRGLLRKVNRRTKLLRYLQRVDHDRYAALVAKLDLRR